MSATHVETTLSIERDGVEIELTIKGNVTAYHPATMYRSNGDPGDPEEGGDIEIESVTDQDGNEIELTEEENTKAQEAIFEALPDPDYD